MCISSKYFSLNVELTYIYIYILFKDLLTVKSFPGFLVIKQHSYTYPFDFQHVQYILSPASSKCKCEQMTFLYKVTFLPIKHQYTS